MTFRTEVRHECSSPAFSFRNPSAEIGAPLGQAQQRPLGAAWLSALPEGVGFVGCLSPRPPRVGPACRDHVTPPRRGLPRPTDASTLCRQVRCAPWAVPFGSAAAALGRQGSNDRVGEIPRQGWSYWPLLMHNNPVMDRPGSAQLSGFRRPRGFRQASAEQTDTTITHQLSGYGCAADPEQIKCYQQHTISHSECLSPICWGF